MATVVCRRCNGAGSIPLSPVLQGTYDIIERGGEEGVSSSTIAAALEEAGDNANLMAIQNRLTRMEEYGLIQRHREEGKPDTWTLAAHESEARS